MEQQNQNEKETVVKPNPTREKKALDEFDELLESAGQEVNPGDVVTAENAGSGREVPPTKKPGKLRQ